MPYSRHEEYIRFDDGLPFRLAMICRTPATLTHEHNWHDNLEFHLLLDGNATEIIDGRNFRISPHDVVAVNSNAIHYTNTASAVRYLCLIADSAFLKRLRIDYDALRFCPPFRDEKTERLFRDLYDLFVKDFSPCRTAKLTAVYLQLIVDLIEGHTRPDTAKQNYKADAFENIKAAVVFIRDNYNQKLSLDKIAKATFVNKYYLSREFKKATGKTVVEYINEYRCKNAARLIADGLRVQQAAVRCGFDNMSYFTKTFYKHTGVRPSEYKRQTVVNP